MRSLHLARLRYVILDHECGDDPCAAFPSHIDAADWCDGGDKGTVYYIVDTRNPSKPEYVFACKQNDMAAFGKWALSR